MHLLPRELDKLALHQAGFLAQKRLARGLRLNATEATALISAQLLELIRDGRHSVAELMDVGATMLGRRHVQAGVAETMHDVQVEGSFPDGTKLVTVHRPIRTLDGNLALALHGSFLSLPPLDLFPTPEPPCDECDVPGALMPTDGFITLNSNRTRAALRVTNDGDRPVQVGSHFHFIETNPKLRFDRALAYGKRLDIPAGTAVRFEPGESKVVALVEIGGNRVICGGNNIAPGPVDNAKIPSILQRIHERGFLHEEQLPHISPPNPFKISRAAYAAAYGPTVGDRLRLNDSALILEIEKDYTTYGDECVFGGGKTIREGMGQNGTKHDDALDLVITNAVIIDYSGIYKADIGVRDGVIVGIGKAGNPDVMDGVHPSLIVGARTEVLAAEGKIITAGAIDTHVHFICPQLCTEALSSGITTLIGGGTGCNTGTCATTCTPGENNIKFMLQATDSIPVNIGLTGKGNCADMEGLRSQIFAGAVGLKLHEDYGTTPAAIDACLTICDEEDIQATIHTDTLNESGFVENTIAAFKGRTIHAMHIEGSGGGHAPDILRACSVENVIPSSTNPTRPYTINTMDEHLDMLMVCHHLNKDIPEDIAFAESRIRAETIAAEDILHDIGAISIMNSDSQAMGRIGEVICRTWQTADKLKRHFGALETDIRTNRDNLRIRRFIAKYTINPAIAHGVSDIVGSVEVGKLADLVLWKPELFGTKPEVVLKSGQPVWGAMGDPNASIPTPQPVLGRPMFASYLPSACLAFVSQSSLKMIENKYHLRKRIHPVKNCRNIKKSDMKLNTALPNLTIDPETYEVCIDGKLIEIDPATTVCMGPSNFLF